MHPYTLSIPDFQQYAGIRESKTRELIAEGEIESVVAAGRRLVIISSWHAYIARQQALPEQDARRNRSGTVPPFGSRRNKNRASPAGSGR